ncbi:MAG: ribosome maturation factor RimM [Crocinitomicaceae bacterium]|jgi:16S rRNA processing protein RimM|nr:ribosome maturation factor RimM [Crocinitomicaceae bacterium]
MKKTDCFQLGYIAKLHGFKGEVSLFMDVTDPSKYASLDALFIEIDQQLIPFFVERIKLKNKGFAALKLEGVDTEEEARRILRKSVFLPNTLLEDLDDKHFYDHEIVGFEVIDAEYGSVGEAEDVIELGPNVLLQVNAKGQEILIPLIPGLVQKVDRANKKLHVEAPEGLLSLYL